MSEIDQIQQTAAARLEGAPGWLPGDYDGRDRLYQPHPSTTVKSSVNLRTQYPEAFSKPYDQFQAGSCVANASAAAYWFQRRRQGLEAFEDYKDPDFEPSRLFVYYASRTARQPINGQYVISDKTNGGTWNRLAMKTLEKLGVCAETTWPYGEEGAGKNEYWKTKVDEYPGAQAFQQASSHRIIEYTRLDDKKPPSTWSTMSTQDKDAVGAATLDNMRVCLSEGHPVVFAFKLYGKVADIFNTATSDGLFELKSLPSNLRHKGPPLDTSVSPNKSFGGHAVLAIGYDDAKKMILVQNSWGDRWSKGGLFWLGYDQITDWEATDDFWMLTFLQRK